MPRAGDPARWTRWKWLLWTAYLLALWFALPDSLRARVDVSGRVSAEASAYVVSVCRAFPEQMAFWAGRGDCMQFARRGNRRLVQSWITLPANARLQAVADGPGDLALHSPAVADEMAASDAAREQLDLLVEFAAAGSVVAGLVESVSVPRDPSTALLLAQASPASATASAAGKPGATAPYTDQLIGGGTSDEPLPDDTKGVPQPQGRRAGSVTYRVDDSRPAGGGNVREQGVEYRYSRDTEAHGAFDLTMSARNIGQFGALAPLPGTPGANTASTLGRFTLTQSRFALNDHWLMDNTLGVLPAFGPALLAGGYRVSLPVSQVEGLKTRIYNDDAEWSVVSGKPGAFTGTTGYGFQAGNALLSGIGGAKQFGPALRAGAQVWTLSGHASVASHTTVALTAEQEFALARLRVKPILVIDDRGKTGAWFDSEWLGAAGAQRAGLYRSARGLLWTDLAIVNDQQGAYWRGDWRGLVRTVSAGSEYTETNLARDSTLSGTRALSAFASISERFSRDLTAGGGVTVRANRPPAETLNPVNSNQVTLNAFAAIRTALGQSRVGVNWLADALSSGERNTSQALRWDQEWLVFDRLRMATNAGYSLDKTVQSGATQRRDLALSVSSAGQGRVFWDGSVSVSAVNAESGTQSRAGNAALNLNWSLDPGWTGALGVQVVRAGSITPTVPDTAARPSDVRVLATLRYDFASGAPFDSSGYRTASYGSGSIEGQVFFDENRDGTRQPNENPAANLTVILDQRHIAVTDATGRFSFRLVPAGEHQIDVIRDRLPLPWELRNPQALRITVPVRDVARPAIGLTRID